MIMPDFYDSAPRIVLYDPLSATLGASADGLLEYGYGDAVRLAGHSCPTVAGAYLMIFRALRHLYGEDTPVRGNIEVRLRDARDQGSAGVVASIATLITGAAGETGFKGLGGRFARNGLLQFGVDIEGEIAFRRRDTGAAIEAALDTGAVPADPATHDLLRKQMAGVATPDDVTRFRMLWQDRIRRMLIERAEDPHLVRLFRSTDIDTRGAA